LIERNFAKLNYIPILLYLTDDELQIDYCNILFTEFWLLLFETDSL